MSFGSDKGKPRVSVGRKATDPTVKRHLARVAGPPKNRMLNTRRALTCVILAAMLTVGLPWIAQSTTGPDVLTVQFPSVVDPLQQGRGSVQYRSPAGVERIQFDVVDGRYYRQVFQVSSSEQRGSLEFALPCTSYAQSVTLRLELWDQQGIASPPQLLTFTCGQPPHYNFSRVLAETMPIGQRLRLNVVILDDGVTTLAEGGIPLGQSAWSRPDARVRDILQADILPALSGIWDQCALGFELGDVRIVNAAKVDEEAQRLLDVDPSGNVAILHSRASGLALRSVRQAWERQLAGEGKALSGSDLLVFVTGARILSQSGGQQVDIEGFSEAGGFAYSLVRWGAVYDQGGSIVLPRQMVSTLAHELGHLLGLEHPDNDAIMNKTVDEYNLMKGSGVTPEPRAQLLPSQCKTAASTLQQLKNYTPAPIAPAPDEAPATAAVSGGPVAAPKEAHADWVGLAEGQMLKGEVELGVAVSGLTFENFGFAEFTYSTDGERFVQIALDREPGDGFEVVWFTRGVPNGRYLLRVTVTDSLRQRLSIEVWVQVNN